MQQRFSALNNTLDTNNSNSNDTNNPENVTKDNTIDNNQLYLTNSTNNQPSKKIT